MDDKERDFYRHKHYGTSPTPATKPKKEKIDVWQLTFKTTGERIIHGAYSLCSWKQKQMQKPDLYKIEPYKK